MSTNHQGKPWPLGSTITGRGVNFCIAAPAAIKLELLLFDHPKSTKASEVIAINDNHRSGDYWHIEIEGIKAGQCYCYRVFYPESQNTKRLISNKILLDPCARAIAGWEIYRRNSYLYNSTNNEACLKGVVCERDEFDFEAHPRPKHPWNKSIIYELHVGGFTKNPQSGVNKTYQGSFKGLKEKIPYLKDLGITTIELLPIFAFDCLDAPKGVENYWGYSPINWFTPHPNYLSNKNPLKAREEIRDFIETCHDNLIEVVIDVVYNHTTEGDNNGPTISWKGFGDSLYYFIDNKGNYLDVTGCGNTVAANRPLVRQLILESMRCWANELGVDGFRFDLGIALSRGENLMPLDAPPLFEEIESDPYLSDLKLISEPWDCGGLYRIKDFPAKRISTWNGHFRDDLRRFWKGEKHTAWNMKERLRGSNDIYQYSNSNQFPINFITAHDGFTLNDLVSYSRKHNYGNNENNRDGENHNNSDNYGIEGPTSDVNIQKIRKKQQRNLLACLLLSPGVPMLLMGDEVSRSQGGNNNTWCQDNSIGWMIWGPEECDIELRHFIKAVLNIREAIPEISNPEIPTLKEEQKEKIGLDSIYIEWHGVNTGKPDWGHWSHTISYSINKGNNGSIAWLGLNAYNKSMLFELPQTTSKWAKIIDTNLSGKDATSIVFHNKKSIELETKSMILLINDELTERLTSE